jgi:hypothetical protein
MGLDLQGWGGGSKLRVRFLMEELGVWLVFSRRMIFVGFMGSS